MAKRRVKSGEGMISALPDELLCHILSFLPTKSAVCASVLSKRWRYLHTLISSIDISINQGLFYPPKSEKLSQFINYVERDLLSRRSIQRFCLKWDSRCGPSRVNNWIAALMCYNIQELELCFLTSLPASLFSSATLVVLKLVSGVVSNIHPLEVPAMVSLPNLKVLHIRLTAILIGDLVKLLSSCPVLDDLFLSKVFTDESRAPCKLNISNATLRRLAIDSLSRSRAVQVVINCPALEYLSFNFFKDQFLVLLAKQCLAEVFIDSYAWRLPLDYAYANANANAHVYDVHVFKDISNIQSLHISYQVLQSIYRYKVDLPLFKNLTYLKVSGSRSTYLFHPRCLKYLLAQCVVLKTLVIERHCTSSCIVKERNDIKYALKQAGLLCHLKTVKIQLWDIRDVEAEDLLKFFKFFLRNAKILEELTIRIKDLPNMQQSKMRTELLTIPRVSEKCRVVLNDEKVTGNIKTQYNIHKARA